MPSGTLAILFVFNRVGPWRSAVPSVCGPKWNLQVELLEPAFIVFRVPFYRRSQGLLVRRLSLPGTKAQARTLKIRSKKKKRGTQERGRIAEPDPKELTISTTFQFGRIYEVAAVTSLRGAEDAPSVRSRTLL